MLGYADVRDFLTASLTARGYGTAGHPEMPLLDPGPVTDAALQQKTPGSLVFVTVGNGAGLALEATYDQVFVAIRTIGLQRDYDGAERLAQDIDQIFLAVSSPRMLGSTRVLYATRAGGGPALIDYDSADRYHFQTNYVVPAATGI